MKSTSALWKTILADETHYTELRVRVLDDEGDVLNTYGVDTLKTLAITQTLIPESVPAIGGAASCTCKLTVMESSENWPRMAPFEVDVRLRIEDEEEETGWLNSEWICMGVFYTDERSETKYGDLSIVGYDGMLLYEQSWTDKLGQYTPASWPITAAAWADIMETVGIIELDESVVLDDTVGLIGLNTISTVREVLQTIAAAHGGNWYLQPDGTLRLVPFVNMDTGTAAIAGIAIAGIAVVGDTEMDVPTGADYTFIGLSMQSLETGPAFDPITGVQLTTEAGNTASAGTDTGYVLKGDCQFSDSAGVAELCLTRTSGYVYKPFDARKAFMNPATEVGDLVIIDGGTYQIMEISWNGSLKMTADIGAPWDEEVDHEYQILSESAKTLRKAMAANADLEARVYSSIEQTENSIITQVGETYETKQNAEQTYVTLQTTLTQTKDALEIEVQGVTDDLDELRLHYRYDANGETIGREGSSKTITLNNEEIDINVNNDPMVIINIDEMVAPRSVRIPVGGNLTVGNVIWLPRSNGNLSEMWVGE